VLTDYIQLKTQSPWALTVGGRGRRNSLCCASKNVMYKLQFSKGKGKGGFV